MNALQIRNLNYTCGGTLKISMQELRNDPNSSSANQAATHPPIVIRWDCENGTHKTQFPAPINTNENNTDDPLCSTTTDLVEECTPTTFGSAGEDAINEPYWKAVELDSTRFSTNFSPHDSGIIAAISQVLLPSFVRPGQPPRGFCPQPDLRTGYACVDHSSLSAELDKFNINPAPSGKCRARVDTLKGRNQFGLLVVCLPSAHQGGELQVRHLGDQISYHWSNDNASTISWAAFSSDCEYEVFEVTSGYRVTLTYNLYIHEHLGSVVQSFASADPTKYPLYNKINELLLNEDWLPGGGVLGYYCEHRYAHTSEDIDSRLPYALKGRDALIYAVFRRGFSLRVHLRPVLAPVEGDPCSSSHVLENRVGSGLHMLQVTNEKRGEDGSLDYLDEAWEHEIWQDVTWINGDWEAPGEVAVVYLARGDQPATAWHYSHLAMLIEIPPSVASEYFAGEIQVVQNGGGEEVPQ
ncbi:hypothetical protein MMC26_004882 [Xylographa opegraphella]|nr:hypothetical protein [Xylographa opegraphella]